MLRDKGTPAAFHQPDLNGSTLAVVELCHLNSARVDIITLQVQLQRVTLEHAQDEVLAKLEQEKLVKRLENMERTIAQLRQLFAAKDSKIAHLEARIEHMQQQQRLPTQDASSMQAFSRNDRILKKRSKSRTTQKSIFVGPKRALSKSRTKPAHLLQHHLDRCSIPCPHLSIQKFLHVMRSNVESFPDKVLKNHPL
jgi:hypothetical protein